MISMTIFVWPLTHPPANPGNDWNDDPNSGPFDESQATSQAPPRTMWVDRVRVLMPVGEEGTLRP